MSLIQAKGNGGRYPYFFRIGRMKGLFERLIVYDERIADAKVAEPFATLADPELPARLDGEAVTGTGASSGGGSNEELLNRGARI